MYVDLTPVGAVLSLICSAVLITTWCLLPRWRTLYNYVSVNQVITGSIHLCGSWLLEVDFSYNISENLVLVNGYLFLANLSWTLCASMIAYLKLVLAYPGKISCEKTKATVFSLGLVFLSKFITDCIVFNIFHTDDFVYVMAVRFVPLYLILFINLSIFIKVVSKVLSCCTKRMSRRHVGHIIAVVGVGSACDVITTVAMIVLIADYAASISSFKMFWMNLVILRLIPQSLIVLFNKRSREHWKWYRDEKRRRRLHNLPV